MSLEKFFFKFSSSKTGLTDDQVLKNKKNFGENKLTVKKRETFLGILLRQFGSFFSVLLMIAATILFVFGDYIDFYVILAVILINVSIESIQRYRSDSIFESLTSTLPAYAVVIRNGKKIKIESSEIVVGDIIVLSAGDKVPVDAIVFEAQDFRVDEALLTGESKAVAKAPSDTYNIDSVTDNYSMVFSGTFVVAGVAKVLVAKTGNDTQLGLIASKMSTMDNDLPIHRNVRKLSFSIFLFVLTLSFLVLIIGLVQMQSWSEILKITVALFVSAIPESLPVMLTLVLAYGFKRMGDKNVLVRKMQSLDVLGQINVLALDKTGTITRNQMKVEKLFTINGDELYVTGDGYEPEGKLIHNQKSVELSDYVDTEKLVQVLTLSSNGSFGYDTSKQDWLIEMGDPTEVSLIVLGEKLGITKENLESEYSLVKDIPFNNQKMYHEVIYKNLKKEISFYSGAPEVILSMCKFVYQNGKIEKLTDQQYEQVQDKIMQYSKQGYRVIATCTKAGDKISFVGMAILNDSIRTDVAQSVKAVYEKGVDIIIITGDHKEIALQIAKSIGIKCDASTLLTGSDMANLTDQQLRNIISGKNIFARVTPQQKLKILEILKAKGKVVAMTGDGVNDSLALMKADIGIAMGKDSSEAAKEASDIVLLDNKFGSITYGIDEGKNIFANIRKTILFLLSTNISEMFVVVLALTLALPLPLSAISILWLNLVTDTFLVIGFAFERGRIEERNSKNLLTWREWARIVYLGLIMTLVALFAFIQNVGDGLQYAQGIVLLVLVIMQWLNVFNIRAGNNTSILKAPFSVNRVFLIGWIISLGLTIFAFHTNFMINILKIQPIGISEWLYALALATLIIWFEEARKFARTIKLFSRK